MQRKQLNRLLWHQHWLILVAILVTCLGLGLFQGLSGSQQWQEMSSPAFIKMQVSTVRYHKATHDYVDRYTHQHYASKAAAIRSYRANELQVYRATPTKKTKTTRGNFGSGLNAYYPMLAILAGVLMVWLTRQRYLNELLQQLGATRAQLYRQQSVYYVGALVIGMLVGSAANLAVLVSRIPNTYFQYFTWANWFGDLIGDGLVAVVLLLFASLLSLVITNGLVVYAIVFAAYWGWWLPIAFFQGGDSSAVPDYLSRHWSLGIGLALGVGLILWASGIWLAQRYSDEQLNQAIAINWLRLPILLILSVPVGVFLSQIFSRLLIGNPGWLSLSIGWLLALFGLIAWLYRPKWSRHLWQLVGQLR